MRTGLLLNPRLAEVAANLFRAAWDQHVTDTPGVFSEGTVGVLTSGSTGGVGSIIALSGEALSVSAHAVNRRLEARSEDVWGLALPLFHVGGYSIPIRAGLSGSRVAEYSEPWESSAFHAWLVREKVSLLSLVPTQLFDLIEGGYRSPADLRVVIVGGGRLDEALHARALASGWPVLQSYGMTECCSQIATARPGTDGRLLEVLNHVEVRVDSETQKLSIRSKALLSARIGFERRGDRYHSYLERPVDEDGWFETSDRVLVTDTPGGTRTLRVLGRDGESVKVMGELVDLGRVRAVVNEVAESSEEFHGWRQRTWIVAVPDERRENEIVLVTDTPRKSQLVGVSASTLVAADPFFGELRERLAPFEVPTRVVWIDHIPRSPLGKVLSSVLTDYVRNSPR